jgi:hypothetical protein
MAEFMVNALIVAVHVFSSVWQGLGLDGRVLRPGVGQHDGIAILSSNKVNFAIKL